MKGIFLPLSPDDAVVQGQVSGPGQMKPIGAAMSRCEFPAVCNRDPVGTCMSCRRLTL